MKFWKKKDKAKSTNPFLEDNGSNSITTEYSQTPTAFSKETNVDHAPPAPTMSNRDYSQDRSNLFSGHGNRTQRYDSNNRTQRYDSNNQEDAYSSSRFAENEEDQEVDQIQRQIRNVKQESLASTRNALQKIGEAESAASNTMNMLGTQSTQIANIDRNLDLSKAYSDRASSQASELKQLNRSIFIPVVKNPFTKGSRERKAMDRVQRDHQEHLAERDDIRKFEYDSSVRVEDAHRKANREKGKEGYHKGRTQSDRNRYQFEADQEDDDIEDEIDSNLDLLGDATARLCAMATGMNDELTSQNRQLNKITKKVDPINEKLMSTTYTLDRTR